MPDIRLTETISISERDITDEEKRLASKYNSLVDECLDWALLEMRFGTHSSRIALASRVITSAARLAGMEVKTQTETHRVAFQQLLQEMTAVDVLEVTPALESAVDQDEDT